MGESLHGFHKTLLEWNRMDTILMVVDRFSKLAKMAPTKTIATFDSTKKFFDMWARHHGMPKFTVNDRNAKFMAGL
jgi:hypothetical protein